MKNQATISKRTLTKVTNLIATKVSNAVSFYGNAHVEVKEYLKGSIMQVEVWFDHHMLCFAGLDTIREVTDAYEEKYDANCICTTIQTRPYLLSDGETFLHMPVVEIMVRVKE